MKNRLVIFCSIFLMWKECNSPHENNSVVSFEEFYEKSFDFHPYHHQFLPVDSVMQYFLYDEQPSNLTYICLVDSSDRIYSCAKVRSISQQDTLIEYKNGLDVIETVHLRMYLKLHFDKGKVIKIRHRAYTKDKGPE